jgi:hypothetical protein
VPVVDQRIAERVVLQIVLEDRLGEELAFGAAEALRQAAGDDVPRDDLDLHDLARADLHLAVGQASDEMRRDAVLLEELEEHFGRPVVDDALRGDRPALLRVERRCVVLEVLDQTVRIVRTVDLLGFSFVEKLTPLHLSRPPELARRDRLHGAGDA